MKAVWLYQVNHQHKQDNMFVTLQSFLMLLCEYFLPSCFPIPQSQTLIVIISVTIGQHILSRIIYKWKHIVCIYSFLAWLLSCRIISLKCIHIILSVLLTTIPFSGHTTNCLFTYTLIDLVCFQCLVIAIKAAINICVQVFVWTYASISLGKCLGLKWLGHMVDVCLTFKEIAKLLSCMAMSFYIPASCEIWK
jgi:hypothetical protein